MTERACEAGFVVNRRGILDEEKVVPVRVSLDDRDGHQGNWKASKT
jgi:hypothetical protein